MPVSEYLYIKIENAYYKAMRNKHKNHLELSILSIILQKLENNNRKYYSIPKGIKKVKE
jgi:hypothetical protein